MKLAILICHLPERHDKLRRLLGSLEPQIERFKDQVYYHINDAGPSLSTGTKRNQLIEQTDSDYFCFVDDDDGISSYYVDEIVKAINQDPDVVTFNGWITEKGIDRKNFTIRLGSKYYEDMNDTEFYYHRFPNHLAVMKRELVRHVKFPDVWQQEDFQWAELIARKNLLKTEVHIPLMLYHYDHWPKERYQRVRR